MPLSLSTLGLFAGVVLAAAFAIYRALLPKPIPGIPCDQAASKRLFGDVPDALKYHAETSEMLSFLVKRCKELDSPIIQVFMRPFQKPWVVVADGREAQDIMSKRGSELDRSDFFGDLFGTILPNMTAVMRTNDHWRSNRRLFADTMSPSFLNTVAAPAIYDNATDLLNLWEQKLRLSQGRAIDVMKDIQMCTVDTIWAAAFGTGLDACRSQEEYLKTIKEVDGKKAALLELPTTKLPETYEALASLAKSSEIPMNNPFGRKAHWFAMTFIPKYRRALVVRDQLIAEKLQASVKNFGSGEEKNKQLKSGIDLVIQREKQMAAKENRKPDFFSPSISDEAAGFLEAGFETTSSTMSWGLKCMTKHQDVQKKLREAVREAFGEEEQPSWEAISKTQVPYVDAFIDEVLRHSGISAANIRLATQDTVILGHVVPKGTDVFLLNGGPSMVSPAMSIDENKRSATSRASKDDVTRYQATDLDVFRPDRWIVTDKDGKEQYDPRAAPMQSFGAGLRGCFGKRLAYLEMRMIYILLVWNFEFQPLPQDLADFKAMDVLTHQPQNVRVKLARAV